MPPQADEHTVLLDSKMDMDAESAQPPPPPPARKSWRSVILWTLAATAAATLLVGMLTIWSHNGRLSSSSFNEPSSMTTTSSTKLGMTRGGGSDTPPPPTDRRFTNSKYNKVQGIGFQIYTGGAPAFLQNHSHHGSQQQQQQQSHLNPECIGRNSYGQVVGEDAPMLQCYIGLPDPMLDVRGRIEIMMDAVEKAYAVVADDPHDNPATLKVFVAPEFFWRGITGAYSFSTDEIPDDPSVCGPICQILVGLENIVAQERFEDWIFLFGTIVASDTLPTEDPYDFLFYNFAPVYKGYNPEKVGFVGKRFLVPKRYVSSSDFLTPQRHLNESSFKQLMGGQPPRAGDATVYNPHDFNQRRYDPTMWNKYKDELGALGYAMIEYDWIMIDGLSFTFEVCFDHQMRTALNTYLGDIVTGRRTLIPSSSDQGLSYVPIPQYQAQISVVSSAGMTVTPDSLALTHGGTIFLQDGLSNVSNRMIWSVDGCEQGLQFEGGTEAAQRRSFLSPTDVIFDHKALSHFQRYDLYQHWHSALQGAFSAEVYPPQVIVFDAVDIAEVTPGM